MISLETILAMEAKIWTTLDGLQSLLRDNQMAMADLKRTLESQKALLAVHAQNAEEILKAPIASLSEFKSLREGTRRLKTSIEANIKRAAEVGSEIRRLSKDIEANNKRLTELEVRAKALQSPVKVTELGVHEDKRSPKAH